LSKEAKALLKKVDKETEFSSSGDAVRELEARLLIYAESVHTERGFHMKQLLGWTSWARRVGLGRVEITASEGKAQLEAVVGRLNRQFNAGGTLPWNRKSRRLGPN
jgi:hypothetical protein